jgi:hypothetical protein
MDDISDIIVVLMYFADRKAYNFGSKLLDGNL